MESMDSVKVNIKKNPVKKTVVDKKENESPEPKPHNSGGGGLWKFIGAVLITAVVAGIVVYGWQKKTTDNTVNKISQESRTVRQQFENQIASLKDTMAGMQTENETLKKAKDSLDAVTQLLATAKKEYVNNDIGLSFEYPAILGEVKLTITDGATGKSFKGEFMGNDKFVFGGMSNDFVSASTSENSLLSTSGFLKKSDKYYYLLAGSKADTDYEIKPMKVLKVSDNDILLFDKASIVNQATGTPFSLSEGNIMAVTNLKKDAYSGISFWNQDQTKLSQADFEKMLNSIKISK